MTEFRVKNVNESLQRIEFKSILAFVKQLLLYQILSLDPKLHQN